MSEQPPPRRRIGWPSSLYVRLAVAFALVSILGIALVAIIAQLRTRHVFDQYIRTQVDSELETQLVDYYTSNQSWQGVETVFAAPLPAPPPKPPRFPYTLVDNNAQVVYGAGRYHVGDVLTQADFRRGFPIETDGEVIGWLLVTPWPDRGDRSPEGDFLRGLSNTIITGVLVAIGTALLMGIALARTLSHPIRALTEATRRVAGGQLGYQVSVHTRDELGELAASFNQMSSDLAHLTDLRRQMTADIAHELRSPLSVILGYTEALSAGKLAGSDQIFGVMHDEARLLQRLIEDLRILSLADAGELPLVRESVNPAALVEQAGAAYTSRAQAKNIALKASASPGMPDLLVDPDRMAQVLGNLVSNALRHTPEQGMIEIVADQTDSAVVFQIRDTGSGITPDDLPHVFDRFYRGDSSRLATDGETGLGLSIARSIVEAHGGSIRVQSSPGKGSTFTISFPLPGVW